MTMRPYRRLSTVYQMTAAVLSLVCVILVLESGGLYDWAQRLEVGPERKIALPIATALHSSLGRFGFENERQEALFELARLKWSDDPAQLAAASIAASADTTPLLPLPSPPGVPEGITGSTATKSAPSLHVHTPTVFPALSVMADAPPLTSKLPEIDPVEPGETRTIALAGDSMMAVGLSPSILRLAPKFNDLAFLKAFKSGTGLARPEVFNWQTEYPAMLKDGPHRSKPDFVLVAIGANDGQGFVDNGVVYPFGSDGWQAIYEQRVQAYLQMLEADGATVIWLGLPPMKSDAYDEHIALVNRIDATVVKASSHAIWFSTAGIVGDDKGHFRDFGDVNGKTVRLRQGDGIHLSDDGAALIASKLLPWLALQKQTPAPDTKHETR